MATLTAATALNNVRTNVNGPGVQSVWTKFNAGAVAMEASAQTVLMCRIPNNHTILEVNATHSTGATSAPTDYGVSGDLSVFASQATQGTRMFAKGLPYIVSLSPNATDQFVYVTATPTLASSTTSYKCDLIVLYRMGKDS